MINQYSPTVGDFFKWQQTILPIIISIVSLLAAICNTFYYTRISNRLSVRTRLTDLMDKVYDLSYERVCLLSNKEEGKYTKIAEKQLRMKHLLFEIDEIAQTEPLSQPQNRLLAESFESLLYFAGSKTFAKSV